MAVDCQKFTLPQNGSYIDIDKHNTKLKCPYVIQVDFECLTTKNEQKKRCKSSDQEHKPCGFILNATHFFPHHPEQWSWSQMTPAPPWEGFLWEGGSNIAKDHP